MRRTRAVVVAALLAAMMTLSGCLPTENLTLSGDELPSEACPSQSTLPVEALTTLSTAECNPVGSVLVFPDGEVIDLGMAPGNTSNTESKYIYSYLNVGTLGIIATRYTEGCMELKSWGSPAAIAKALDAYGDDLGNC